MPLNEVSPNMVISVNFVEACSRKRSHDDYSKDGAVGLKHENPSPRPKIPEGTALPPVSPCESSKTIYHASSPLLADDSLCHTVPPTSTASGATSRPNVSNPQSPPPSPPDLDNSLEKGAPSTSFQVPCGSPHITPPGRTPEPPIKRVRLTLAEKETRARELAETKRKREEQRSARQAEKAKEEAEKEARAQEREEHRRKREEEKAQKMAEASQKAEAARKAGLEKEKKERAQTKLNVFFSNLASKLKTLSDDTKPTPIPIPVALSVQPALPAGATICSVYEQRFPPFFVKDQTRLAVNPFTVEGETLQRRSSELDKCISNAQADATAAEPLPIVQLLGLETARRHRGVLRFPVQHIMEELSKLSADQPTTGKQVTLLAELGRIPMKLLAFHEDVRPPYFGTQTLMPAATARLVTEKMSRAARRSAQQRLPLHYDYDSEAEWQDEEDGEDVDDADDEDDEPPLLDGEDDMAEFLDDSDDLDPAARRVFHGEMEPESTGLCFEDLSGRTDNEAVRGCKMEFILDGFDLTLGLDPWSNKYWEVDEPRPKKRATPAASENQKKDTTSVKLMLQPPVWTHGAKAPGRPPKVSKEAALPVEESCPLSSERIEHIKQLVEEYQRLDKKALSQVIASKIMVSVEHGRQWLEQLAQRTTRKQGQLWILRSGQAKC